MIGKKFLAFSLSAVIMAGSAMSASAAGVKDVFNADTYANKYSDLKTAFGTDAAKLLEHFKAFGAKEGRVASPILDVAAYRKAYADLNAAYGDNWDAYVDHYLKYGINEGRTTGVLFDLVDYANKNADVKAAYGNDYSKIAEHYVTKGINEKRPGGTIAQASASSSSSNNSGSSAPATTPTTPAKPSGTTSSSTSNGGSTTTTTTTTFVEHQHVWKDTGNSYPGTCTENGWKEQECTVQLYKWNADKTATVLITDENGNPVTCDALRRVSTGAGHVAPSYDNTTTGSGSVNYYTIPATCTTKGIEKYTCTRCGTPVTNDLDIIPHQYKDTVYAPTSCSRKAPTGYTLHKCIFCGKEEKDTFTYLDHQVATYDIEVNKPSCIAMGHASGFCSKCGELDTKNIAMTDHTYKDVTVYVDSYTEGKGAPCHVAYTLSVCSNKDCRLINPNVAIPDGTDSPCVKDASGKYCVECGHAMDRNHTNQVMKYIPGDILNVEVGQ